MKEKDVIWVEGRPGVKMSAFRMARILIFRRHKRLLILIGLIFLVSLIAGLTVDLRCLLAGFFLLLVLSPAILAFIFYSDALRPECMFNSLYHTIDCTENRITIITLVKNDEEGAETETTSPESETDQTTWRVVGRRTFELRELKSLELFPEEMIVTLRDPLRGFIWIPEAAFPTAEEYNRTVAMLRKCQNR